MDKTVRVMMLAALGMAGIAIGGMTIAGCTENSSARNWGGTMNYTVPKGQKVTNVTWKEEDLWVLTRPMKPEETPEVWTFTEDTANVLWQKSGKVILTESR